MTITLPVAFRRGSTILALTFVAALAGCGSSTSDAAEPAALTSTTEPTTATSGSSQADHDDDADHDDGDDLAEDSASTTAPPGGAVAEADVVIEVSFVAGAVTVEQDRVEVTQGQTVGIVLSSDVDESAHVHGYDLSLPVSAGATGEVVFTADTPGVFEVELHESGTFLFEMLVR